MSSPDLGRAIFLGFDPRLAEREAFDVARFSIRRRLSQSTPINAISLAMLRHAGLYSRPTRRKMHNGAQVLWDEISGAPMSTEFAISRFLVPHLMGYRGVGVFADCDVLALADLGEIFALAEANPDVPLWCVHHNHLPSTRTKMDGQIQTIYFRKNWSSVMVFRCDHPANRRLDAAMVNSLPGRDLHRFCWLDGEKIGSLDPSWNVLVGEHRAILGRDFAPPKLLHFTLGTPNMPGYEACDFADLWREELAMCRGTPWPVPRPRGW